MSTANVAGFLAMSAQHGGAGLDVQVVWPSLNLDRTSPIGEAIPDLVLVNVLHIIRVFQVIRSLVRRGRPRKNTCPVVVSITPPASQHLKGLQSSHAKNGLDKPRWSVHLVKTMGQSCHAGT